MRSLALGLPMLAVLACSKSPDTDQGKAAMAPDSAASAPAAAPSANAPTMLRGTVASVSPTQVILRTDSGTVTVKTAPPVKVYTREPSSLANVKETTFIGVTTVKQPDGSERATEIHIFPEELRGMGEGSRMMAPAAGGAAGTASRMTNGAVAQSRMSNGSVASTNGSSLVVRYAGGSQTVTVPPNTPVTELKLAARPLAAGDQAALVLTRAPDGSLTTSTAVLTSK